MRSFTLVLIVSVAGIALAATWCPGESPATTAAAKSDSAPVRTPRAVIEKVMNDVLAVLRDTSLTTPEKAKTIRQIADEQIDFETLARLSMGRYWRDLSENDRSEFVKEFRNHVSSTHGHVINEYVDEEVKITGDRQETRGDWTVQTLILSRKDANTKKEVAKVDYRLRQKDSNWQIIDITIEGVSMAANFRSQFQDIMANGGIERLMKLLREKNIANQK